MINGVLVLAAGKSRRIAARSQGGSKPLLEIGGKPIIGHTLDWLAASGIATVWINLHYHADTVRATVGDGTAFGLTVRYSVEPELLGTAGAWKKLHQEWGRTSLVVYGDNLMRFDLLRFLAVHRRAGTLATAALFDPAVHPNTGMAGGYAMVETDSRVARFVEGDASGTATGYVNAGAYLLEQAVGDWIPDGFQDFGRDILPRLASAGRLAGHVLEREAFCLGLDTPASFARGEELLRAGSISLA